MLEEDEAAAMETSENEALGLGSELIVAAKAAINPVMRTPELPESVSSSADRKHHIDDEAHSPHHADDGQDNLAGAELPVPDSKRVKLGHIAQERSTSAASEASSDEEGELREDEDQTHDQEEGEVHEVVEEGEVHADAEQNGHGEVNQGEARAADPTPNSTMVVSDSSADEKPTSGWNKGISSTLRTTLGAARPPKDKTGKMVYSEKGLKLLLPPLNDPSFSGTTWKATFLDWTQALVAKNEDLAGRLDASVVKAAYYYHLEDLTGWTRKKKRAARAAARNFDLKGKLAALLDSLQHTLESVPPTSDVPAPATRSKEPSSSQSAPIPTAQPVDQPPTQPEPNPPSQPNSVHRKAENAGLPTASDWAALLADPPGTEENLEADLSDNDAVSKLPTMATLSNGTARVPTAEEEAALLALHFPRATAADGICVLCAGRGHRPAECPDLYCKFCKSDSHYHHQCPTRVRCTSCWQLGHDGNHCKKNGKKKKKASQSMECALCASTEHLEADCDTFWRTYKPKPEEITKKVVSILAFCCTCGAEGHYMSDCPKMQEAGGQGKKKPYSRTWSLQNRDMYIDPDCGRLSISEASNPAQQARKHQVPGPPEPSRGPRRHVFYASEEDSEEGEFIGERIRPPRPSAGQINLSSNIQFSNVVLPAPTSSTIMSLPSVPQYPINPPPPPPPQLMMNTIPGLGVRADLSQSRTRRQRGDPTRNPPLPAGPPPPGLPQRPGFFDHPPPPPPLPSFQKTPHLPGRPPATRGGRHQSYHSVPPPPEPQSKNASMHRNSGSQDARRSGKKKRGGKRG
jgi:protein AIR1/2